MNNESRALIIALIAGVFAVFLAYSYSQEKKAEYDKLYKDKTRIIVAAKDIAEMETIDDSMIEIKEMPSEFAQPGFAKNMDDVIGQVAATALKKGEQVLFTKLLTPGPETGIALQISPRKRAITLPVDEVRGVAKLIRPGDRIDIFAAIDVGKGVNARREVSLIMQDVPVIATGLAVVNNIPRILEFDASKKELYHQALTGDTKYSTLTVEADPKEAQDLIYIVASSPGNLFYTLRNPNDREKLPRMTASTAESISGRPASPASSDGPNAIIPRR